MHFEVIDVDHHPGAFSVIIRHLDGDLKDQKESFSFPANEGWDAELEPGKPRFLFRIESILIEREQSMPAEIARREKMKQFRGLTVKHDEKGNLKTEKTR